MAFSFGGAGIAASFEGSLSRRSSCWRCFSRALRACRVSEAGVGAGDGEWDMVECKNEPSLRLGSK
jgi:hypothetical protein